MDENDDDVGLLEPRQSPEQATAAFRAALEDLDETQSGLAARMTKLGDRRPFSTVLRSVQRMASGEARVSGEMQVIVDLLSQQRRRAIHAASRLEWKRDENGVAASAEGFDIYLDRQTRGRWRVNVVDQETYHAQPWPRWQDSLETAKIQAMVTLEEAIDEELRLGLR